MATQITPVVIDTTKATLAKFPGYHVIRSKDGAIVALCPLIAEPVCEGQFSFAPMVQRATNCHDDMLDTLRVIGGPKEVDLGALSDDAIRGILYAIISIAQASVAKTEERS